MYLVILFSKVCWSLLICAPFAPSRQHALPIIDTRFTHLRAYVPLLSSIGTLGAFVLSCVVLLELKDKVRFVCALQLTIHPSILSFISFVLPYEAVLHVFFLSFILNHSLHHNL